MSKCRDCRYYDSANSYSGWCEYYSNMKVDEDEQACSHFSESGYSSSSTGCFLTTACCEYKGLPDNCHELTVMRSFRDHYLKKKEYGVEMIKQYYDRAPKIVDRIYKSDRKTEICEYIYSQICKLVDLYENEKYDDIAARYLTMMYKVDLLTMGEQ